MEDGAEMEQCATVCTNSSAPEQDKAFTESDVIHMQSTALSSDDAMHVQSEELCAVETTNECSVVNSLDPAQLAEDVRHTDTGAKLSNPR